MTRGTGPFGVATNAYGSGMIVADRFETLDEARQFTKRYQPGGAVLCTFRDGAWRKVQFATICPAAPSVGEPGNTELRCAKCGGRVGEHRAEPVLV